MYSFRNGEISGTVPQIYKREGGKKKGLGGIRKNIIISFFAKIIVPLGTNNRLDECAQS